MVSGWADSLPQLESILGSLRSASRERCRAVLRSNLDGSWLAEVRQHKRRLAEELTIAEPVGLVVSRDLGLRTLGWQNNELG